MKKIMLDQINQVDPLRVLRFCLWVLCERVANEVALEHDLGRAMPQTSHDLDLLSSIATTIVRLERGTELTKMRSAMNEPQEVLLSLEAQEIAQLSSVDQQLVRAWGEKYLARLRRKESGENAQKVLEVKRGAEGEPNR